MERDAQMPDLTLLLQLQRCFIGMASFVLGKQFRILGMHQIEIEILHAAGIQLHLENGADLFGGIEISRGELIGKDVTVSGIPGSQRLAQRDLALLPNITVRRVEIIEAGSQERIHHFGSVGKIHLVALHGQAHKAETEFALDLRKNVLYHSHYLTLGHPADHLCSSAAS